MLWIKALHLIFVITWFAGLFYLPRLFVYHAMSTDEVSIARFKIMERKLYYGIMLPSAVLTIGLGAWLLGFKADYYLHQPWFLGKLLFVFLLVIYHLYCGHLYKEFKHDRNRHGHVFYRWLNEVPVVFLFGIVILAVVNP